VYFNLDCTFHMCPYRSWFETYEERVNKNKKNDNTCKFVGVEFIKIHMQDGVIEHYQTPTHSKMKKKPLF